MIWLAIALLAAAAMAPVTWAAWRGGRVRSRRDAAVALHQAQLHELDRDLAEGRLLESEHAAARLEVQRRLLADAALADADTRRSGPALLTTIAALAPAAALLLYVAEGHPDYKAQQRAAQEAAANATQGSEKDAALIEQLRQMLTKMDPIARDRATSSSDGPSLAPATCPKRPTPGARLSHRNTTLNSPPRPPKSSPRPKGA